MSTEFTTKEFITKEVRTTELGAEEFMSEDLKRIEELTGHLIRFASSTALKANESLEFAAEYLRDSGLEPEVLENQGHKMLICRVGSGSRCLILNGHLDVVEGKDEQYLPQKKGGRLYGRGSYDMLGACAVMLYTMRLLKKKQPGCQVVLSLSTTEETAGALCTGYMVEHGLSGDFAICGEPTNLAVSVMSKGVLRVKCHVFGVAAHSSRPWQGENAILKAFEIYQKICQLPFAKRTNEYFEGASINLSKIQGGMVLNQVPDRAEMIIDIRYLPGENRAELVREIQALDSDMKVEIIAEIDAVEISRKDRCLRFLADAVTEATGEPCRMIAQHGAADTAFFQKAGIPSVEFGPCGAGHHGPEEYVEMASLEIFLRCVEGMIARMEAQES